MSLQEDLLIKRSQDGDITAFEELISAYQQRIYNTAYRLLGNPHDASDMAQEAIIKIYKGLPGFRGDSSFSTWSYRITVNVCRDELSRKYRHMESSLDEYIITETGEMPKEIADNSQLPEDIMASRELGNYLQTLINNLPPEYRLVIIMREHLSFSYKEIADALDISIGTVKSRINRARKALKKKILIDAELYPQLLSQIAEGRDNDESA
ncbi:MAG: RNA polymerase sigma factor [Bacillota bacterium]|jgi:RNA polymerase sigma-70 factor (ECF subfamily)